MCLFQKRRRTLLTVWLGNYFAISLLLLFAVCHSVISTQAEHFTMGINEKGTNFDEDIEIDEEKDAVIFRVPAHNNVVSASFLIDFKLGLTITRIPTRKECHVSKMDPGFSSPGKVRKDLVQASLQPDPLPVITKRHLVKVTGAADRQLLTKEILDFCGVFPIYNIKQFEINENETDGSLISHRVTRQVISDADFVPCKKDFVLKYVENCMKEKWDLNCKMQSDACFYRVRCKNLLPRVDDWKCEKEHLSNTYPICCDLICPLPTP